MPRSAIVFSFRCPPKPRSRTSRGPVERSCSTDRECVTWYEDAEQIQGGSGTWQSVSQLSKADDGRVSYAPFEFHLLGTLPYAVPVARPVVGVFALLEALVEDLGLSTKMLASGRAVGRASYDSAIPVAHL